MATNNINTRIALKYDTWSAWNNDTVADAGANLVLLPGEIGICEILTANTDANASVVPTVLFKVGGAKYTAADAASGLGTEGELKKFKHLPWASAKAADVYAWAKAETVALNDKNELEFKTGNSVIHTVSLASLTSELSDRLDAVEAELGIGDSETTNLAALIERITTAEGAIKDLEDADTLINEKFGAEYSKTATVAMAIDAAKQAAIDDAAGKIGAVEDKVDANTENIGKNTKAIADEAVAREAADGELADRIATLEVFFDGADADGEDGSNSLYNALDTLKEIQEYLKGDGEAANDLLTKVSANATAIETNKGNIEGLDDKIDAEAAKIVTLQDIVSGYTAKGSIAAAVEAAQAQADKGVSDAAAAQGTANSALGIANAAKEAIEDPNTGLAAIKAIADGNSDRLDIIEADYMKTADSYIFNCGNSSKNI